MSKEQAELRRWLEEVTDPELSAELLSIRNEEKEVHERFYRPLEFGTGGLRGELGAGTNRMNIYTVRQATQGFAAYLLTQDEKPSAAISYDSRHQSDVFARETARVLAANGIKVYLYPHLMPTPALSFAVLDRHCTGGVMVTASHNPAKYNGYKAYGPDGCQITSQAAAAISAAIAGTDAFTGVKSMDFDEAVASGKVKWIEDAVLERYYDAVLAQSVNNLSDEQIAAAPLKLVYTPLNGTGLVPVTTVLARAGVSDVTVVPEQEQPDGNFPTCPYPNPEIREAMQKGIDLCEQVHPDLLLATDPDADRIGMALRDENGQYVLLNGNQTCSLLVYYIVKRWSELGRLRGKEYIVKTIVTTELVARIAESFGVRHFDCLTGFKYIATVMRNHEQTMQYICGGEESFGFLAEDFVRDKDAVSACSLAAEAAAWAKSQDMTLYELLKEMYVRYGFFREALVSVVRKGKEGQEEIAKMMSDYRSDPPRSLGGSPIVVIKDYLNGEALDLTNGSKTPIDMERSNVLQFTTADSTVVSIRPSGTEPKIKFYFGVRAELNDTARFNEVQAELDGKIESIKKEMGLV